MTPLKPKSLAYRKVINALVTVFCIISISIALYAMWWILKTVFEYGADAITWEFLTQPTKPYGEPGAGIANALLGTLYMTLGASLLAVPAGLAAGIYLAEFGKNGRFASLLRFCGNVLMGVPSIIIGLFVYIIVVIPAGHFSGWAGTVALSIIMFPVIMRTTEDILQMVPDALRESSLALGMTRLRATLCIVSRSARNGQDFLQKIFYFIQRMNIVVTVNQIRNIMKKF